MQNITPAQLISNIRLLSFTRNDLAVTDADIVQRLDEAVSSLYDLIVAAYEHYAIKSFDFTLTSTTQAVTLPDDFYKDNSVDYNPDTQGRMTVHRYEWLDRNDVGRRQYSILDDQLIVNPPQLSSGNYRLYYTPVVQSFFDPAIVVQAGDDVLTSSSSVPRDPFDTVTAASGHIQFNAASFGVGDIGKYLYMTGCSNAVNNGLHLITAVLSGTIIVVSGTLADELLGVGVTADLTGNLTTSTWTFANAAFDSTYIGQDLIVFGTANPVCNDGTFTVGSIVSVLSPTQIVTVSGYPLVTETFVGPQVLVQAQPAGTFWNPLPMIFKPWYEYIQVHAALAIKSFFEMDTTDLEGRLAALTKRVETMASNRMEEGGQAPMVDGRQGWWNDTDGGFYGF